MTCGGQALAPRTHGLGPACFGRRSVCKHLVSSLAPARRRAPRSPRSVIMHNPLCWTQRRGGQPPMERGVLVEGLTKSFGQSQALQGLDLVVQEGSVGAVLGPNGA